LTASDTLQSGGTSIDTVSMAQRIVTQPRRALSVREAAHSCGLSRTTLYRLIADGKLLTLKIGSRRLVRPEAIEALLEAGEAK
jgi:excisionase family DNA binding protein